MLIVQTQISVNTPRSLWRQRRTPSASVSRHHAEPSRRAFFGRLPVAAGRKGRGWKSSSRPMRHRTPHGLAGVTVAVTVGERRKAMPKLPRYVTRSSPLDMPARRIQITGPVWRTTGQVSGSAPETARRYSALVHWVARFTRQQRAGSTTARGPRSGPFHPFHSIPFHSIHSVHSIIARRFCSLETTGTATPRAAWPPPPPTHIGTEPPAVVHLRLACPHRPTDHAAWRDRNSSVTPGRIVMGASRNRRQTSSHLPLPLSIRSPARAGYRPCRRVEPELASADVPERLPPGRFATRLECFGLKHQPEQITDRIAGRSRSKSSASVRRPRAGAMGSVASTGSAHQRLADPHVRDRSGPTPPGS